MSCYDTEILPHIWLLSAEGWCSLTPFIVFVQSPSSTYSGNLCKISVHFLAKIGLYFSGVIRSTIQTDDLKSAKFCDQWKVNFLGVNFNICSAKPLSLCYLTLPGDTEVLPVFYARLLEMVISSNAFKKSFLRFPILL